MTNKEAKDFLTHYICSCPYGNSPANCGDNECKFGVAIRTLCVDERPQGEWGKWIISAIQCPECLECFNFPTKYYPMEMLKECPNCGVDMRGGRE